MKKQEKLESGTLSTQKIWNSKLHLASLQSMEEQLTEVSKCLMTCANTCKWSPKPQKGYTSEENRSLEPQKYIYIYNVYIYIYMFIICKWFSFSILGTFSGSSRDVEALFQGEIMGCFTKLNYETSKSFPSFSTNYPPWYKFKHYHSRKDRARLCDQLNASQWSHATSSAHPASHWCRCRLTLKVDQWLRIWVLNQK